MEPQKQTKPGTGDTVSITVSIPKAARQKLRRMKELLGYHTLDETVTKAVDLVNMNDVFVSAMKSDGIDIGSIRGD